MGAGAQVSRTRHSARNATVSVASRVVAILAGYAVRIVFTHTLSATYVGLNGLFLDIINILSLSELGIETAITFALYGPVAAGDEAAQRDVMALYARLYRGVAVAVTLLGLAVMPLLPRLIADYALIDDIRLIYLLYLANAAVSYLFVYKRTIIEAHQMRSVSVLYRNGFLLLQYALQVVALLVWHAFLPYLVAAIACTIAGNVALSRRADRMYPFLRAGRPRPLAAGLRRSIARDVRALLLTKVGTVAVNGTDNLVLTYFCGIVTTGVYSNYYLVIGSVRQLIEEAFRGIAASVGNLGVTADADRVERVLRATLLAAVWGFGIAAICLYELLSPFVGLSFGNSYVFGGDVLLVLCVNFFVMGLRLPTDIFHDALGLFWYDRWRGLAEAVVNLAVSVALAARVGAIGVFVGTLVASVLTSSWIEPWIVYRRRLGRTSRPYFARLLGWAGVVALAWAACDLVCRVVCGGLAASDVAAADVLGVAGSAGPVGDVLLIVVRLAVCLVVGDAVLLVSLRRTREFRLLVEKARGLVGRRRRPRRPRGPQATTGRADAREDGVQVVGALAGGAQADGVRKDGAQADGVRAGCDRAGGAPSPSADVPRFALRRAAGAWMLVELDAAPFAAHRVLSLNDSGAFLWEALAGRRPGGGEARGVPTDVVAAYARRFGISDAQAAADAADFVRGMRALGALPTSVAPGVRAGTGEGGGRDGA
ncbi:PqqD family peptide modification chaperone [bacterium]|nr:PqqD family peptide modification chaperone [bacterium]